MEIKNKKFIFIILFLFNNNIFANDFYILSKSLKDLDLNHSEFNFLNVDNQNLNSNFINKKEYIFKLFIMSNSKDYFPFENKSINYLFIKSNDSSKVSFNLFNKILDFNSNEEDFCSLFSEFTFTEKNPSGEVIYNYSSGINSFEGFQITITFLDDKIKMVNITGVGSEELSKLSDSILSDFIFIKNEVDINEDMGGETFSRVYNKTGLKATEISEEWYILTIERK